MNKCAVFIYNYSGNRNFKIYYHYHQRYINAEKSIQVIAHCTARTMLHQFLIRLKLQEMIVLLHFVELLKCAVDDDLRSLHCFSVIS